VTIHLTDEPQIIYPTSVTRNNAPVISVIADGTGLVLRVNRSARRLVDVDPMVSHRVHVLLSRTQLFVQVTSDGSRTMTNKGDIAAADLRSVFALTDGQRIEIPVELDGQGRLVGRHPDSVITRQNMAARRARLANGKAA
jgi:hypothetical protein